MSGGGGVMVQGAFSERGKSELAVIVGNQDAEKYISTLKNYLLLFAAEKNPGSWIFQQDNASIHTAHIIKNWFEDKSVDIMDWAAKRSHLNPIENLWGYMARKVYGNIRQFQSDQDLKDFIFATWESVYRVYFYMLAKKYANSRG